MNVRDWIPKIKKIEFYTDLMSYMNHEMSGELVLNTIDERLINEAKSISRQIRVLEKKDRMFQFKIGTPMQATVSSINEDYHDYYCVSVEKDGINILSMTDRGLYYGLLALKRLKRKDGSFPICRFEDWSDIKVRSEYLEFRNYYPKFQHVLQYIGEMALRHSNAVVIEMEDKRPSNQELFSNDSGSQFSREEIERLKETAYRHFIELIPLQQTFGHLEYVLSNKKYQSLREVKNQPGELCPSNPMSLKLAQMLVQDLVDIFPSARYVHLGTDEVRNINCCELCKERKLTNGRIFIEFINKLVSLVTEIGRIPLIWHDMLLNCTEEELSILDKRIIVVVWLYDGNDMEYRAHKIMDQLRKLNISMWGACAVRCWDYQGLQNYPRVQARINNILSWTSLAKSYGLEGMIATNWSAYSAISSPYGIYETSVYTAYYAAEHFWNSSADSTDYLRRYLLQYHKISDTEILSQGWQTEDYFMLLPKLLSKINDHKEIAELMSVIKVYEDVTQRSYPVSLLTYRVRMNPYKEVEWEALFTRYLATNQPLKEIKDKWKLLLTYFLPDDCVDSYLASRYEAWEIVECEVLRMANHYHRTEFYPILTESKQ